LGERDMAAASPCAAGPWRAPCRGRLRILGPRAERGACGVARATTVGREGAVSGNGKTPAPAAEAAKEPLLVDASSCSVVEKEERWLPEDYQLAQGEVSAIQRDAPTLPEDVFRCVGCTKAECQGPQGCALPFRHQEMGYLRQILTSAVYDVAVETPLDPAPRLSEATGNRVLLKREDMQPVFSFKLRGAYNKIASLTQEELARGVICSSAGNHAQGVALAASKRGGRALICMPTTTPEIKISAVRRLGGEVVLHGETYSDTQQYAIERAKRDNLVFVAPYDDPYVIAGQGTIGMEILRQCPGTGGLHAVFVAIGGGGLAAGVAAYIKSLRPDIKIIGVEPTGSNAMAMSLAQGKRVRLDRVDGFADGVAVKYVGAETMRLCRELLDGVVLVSNSEISAAIKDVFNDTRSILEPAGAVAVAGAKAYAKRQGCKGQTLVCVTSGANMNFDRLRLVSELADVGARAEAMLMTVIPESPGSFRRFVEAGFYAPGADLMVTEFRYRFSSNPEGKAHILYSVGISDPGQVSQLKARLDAAGMPTEDISGVEEAAVHLRHLVGGRARSFTGAMPHERIFRVEFPEKAGALGKFLAAMGGYNITLFHYRYAGGDTSSVLLGMQVVPGEGEAFRGKVADLDGSFVFRELSDRAYDVFSTFLS